MDRLDRSRKFGGLHQHNRQSGCASAVAPHSAGDHTGATHANDPAHAACHPSAVTIAGANHAGNNG